MEIAKPLLALDGRVDPHWLWAIATRFTGYLLKGDDRLRSVVELDSDAEENKRQRAEFVKLAAAGAIEVPDAYLTDLARGPCTYFVARLGMHDINNGSYSSIAARIKPVFVGGGEAVVATNAPPTMPSPVVDEDLVAWLASGRTMQAESRIRQWLSYSPLRLSPLKQSPGDRGIGSDVGGHTFGHEIELAQVDERSGHNNPAEHWGLGKPGNGMPFLAETVLPPPSDEGAPPADRQPVVIGVIDIGCPFAHAHFAEDSGDKPGTRIRYFWDQGRVADWRLRQLLNSQTTAPWVTPLDFGYGREADAPRLSELMEGWLGKKPFSTSAPLRRHDRLFEQACYACAGLPELLAPNSHGAHVLDIAAGRGFVPNGCTPLEEDCAAQAPIVFVQLPELAVSDLSGAWLDAYVIDAVNYIIDRARRIDSSAKVVINLSFGSFAGPHDGSSVVERALDGLALDREVVIVLAAGNVPPGDQPIHASGRLSPGEAGTVIWNVAGGDSTQSFMQVWARGDKVNQHGLAVTLTPPGGGAGTLGVDGFGVAVQHPGPGWRHDVCTAMVACCRAPQSDDSAMALLAVGPTADRVMRENDIQPAAPGPWRIEVRNAGPDPIEVHCWIERDEPRKGDPDNGRQSALTAIVGSPIAPILHGTLTAQACGLETIVVGGAQVDGPRWEAAYERTATGPTRTGLRTGPDLVAPAVRRVRTDAHPQARHQLRGIEAVGNVSGSFDERIGTSMAAPWVCRQVASLLAQGVNPTRAALVDALCGRTSGAAPTLSAPRTTVGNGVLLPDGSFLATGV